MKKIMAMMVCAVLCCALLAGCGGSDKPTESAAVPANDAAAGNAAAAAAPAAPSSKYTFSFNGVEIAANAEMAPLAETLGEPIDYFESESCAYQGLDKVYTYSGVIIRTYPADGKDYVLTVELKDDTVTTKEGVYIGASKDDVTAAYGAPTSETDTAISYVDGDCTLSFMLADGKVTDITYAADTD